MNPLRLVTLAGDPEREPEVAGSACGSQQRRPSIAVHGPYGTPCDDARGRHRHDRFRRCSLLVRCCIGRGNGRELGFASSVSWRLWAEADRLAALGASLIPAGSSAAEISVSVPFRRGASSASPTLKPTLEAQRQADCRLGVRKGRRGVVRSLSSLPTRSPQPGIRVS